MKVNFYPLEFVIKYHREDLIRNYTEWGVAKQTFLNFAIWNFRRAIVNGESGNVC